MNHPKYWACAEPRPGRCDVYMSPWFNELIHSQGLSFSAYQSDYLFWWAWTLSPLVVPEGGAW